MSNTFPVHAVLLAAGLSTRFGSADKLLADVNGKPLVRRAAERLLDVTALDGVTAVVAGNAQGDLVAAALRGLPLRIAVNSDAERGMGSSISCGVAAIADAHAGIMVVPGDMPALDAETLSQLISLYRNSNGRHVVYPITPAGDQRNPVLWPADLRRELLTLSGPQGGKQLLAEHRARTVTYTASPRVFEDIDTQDDLLRFRLENSQA